MSLISIIVPCYNQAQYLDECLQSVLEQTYQNWECIIVNDGSPDHTVEVAKKWVENDKRIKYLFQKNAGVSSSRNLGISNAKGEFILPLDADDKIGKEYVSIALDEFQKDSTLKVVYCKAEKFGDELGISQMEQFSLFNLSRENMIFCSALFKKEDWKRVGGYDINMIHGLEDWEFWIAILKNGGGVKCLDFIGFYYRIKLESRQTKISNDNYKYLFEYLSIKHADFFVKQFGSFIQLKQDLKNEKQNLIELIKSKKFTVDLFCKTFFGFTLFGFYKKLFK